MSRRGGRRQVLQLGDSTSKLHRYGYSKGFQSKESSDQGQGSALNLVGDYSDSDSDDNKDDSSDVNQLPHTEEQEDSPAVEDTPATVNDDGKEDLSNMDDELRNFLSEIEAIPMPEDTKASSNPPSQGPSPTPSHTSHTGSEETPASVDEATVHTGPATTNAKNSGAYSMFVKGEVEFSHSPVAVEAGDDKEQTKESGNTNLDVLDCLEEPKTEWQMVQDETTQYYYYWNWKTNAVTWEIPLDYTQYLLLHKEYEEKLSKLTPQQRQALKDKKTASKEKEKKVDTDEQSASARDSETDKRDKVKSRSGDLDSEVRPRDEIEELSHSQHHHKKKKSKKHKRRHDNEDDETAVHKEASTADSARLKSTSKTSKPIKMIGPLPLSIVPYISDNEDKELEEEEEENKVLPNFGGDRSDSINERLKSPSAGSKDDSVRSPSAARKDDLVRSPLGDDEDLEKLVEKPSHEAMMPDSPGVPHIGSPPPGQDNLGLIELHQKENETVESNAVEDDKHIETKTAKHLETEVDKPLETGVDLQSKEKEEEINVIFHGDPIKKIVLEEELENTETQLNVIAVDNKKEEELRRRKKAVKKKKEVIDMFDDSPPQNGGQSEEEMERGRKMEVEDGEISDGAEFLCKPVIEKSRVEFSTEKMPCVPSVDEKSIFPVKDSVMKGIVGYSEDDEEEEEGELKEEVPKVVKKEKPKLLIKSKWNDGKSLDRKDKDKTLLYNGKTAKKDSHVDSRIKSEGARSLSPSPSSGGSTKDGNVSDHISTKDNSELEKDSTKHKNVFDSLDVKLSEKEEDKASLDGSDLDLDDLDNIDMVLEMALEKKRDQKTDSKKDVEKEVTEATPTVASTGNKTQDSKKVECDVMLTDEQKQVTDDTDVEKLKCKVKDSCELAMSKLRFLDISTKSLSKLQILLIELQTRYHDWQGGGLSTIYFNKQLQSSEALLSQYEESAVPPGWRCQWDRSSSRYFYLNLRNDRTQWEYPEVVEEGELKERGGGAGEDREAKRKKRSKEKEEVVSKPRGNSSSRSSRHRSSKKGQEKERSKRDRHSSSVHHHRKKKRRRREHSSSSSSEEESIQPHHRHSRSKRKKRGRSDRSPSVEVLDVEEGKQSVQLIEDSPPSALFPVESQSVEGDEEEGVGGGSNLVADYGSEQDPDKEDEKGEDKEMEDIGKEEEELPGDSNDADTVDEAKGGKEELSIDGDEMAEDEAKEVVKEEEEDNSAVIVRAPQIIVPPYVAAMNQPQLYTAPTLYASASLPSSATSTALPEGREGEGETATASEEVEKGYKKKKKDKAGKEKPLTANSSIMMKKKRVSSMVQKWQQVKKEVEKEDRAKELRQAAIREKINQLK